MPYILLTCRVAPGLVWFTIEQSSLGTVATLSGYFVVITLFWLGPQKKLHRRLDRRLDGIITAEIQKRKAEEDAEDAAQKEADLRKVGSCWRCSHTIIFN